MKRKNSGSTQRGQSLVEFSISMVLILILLAGLVDFGRAVFTYMALRDAAQEGATYGAVNPTLTSAIEDRVFGSSTTLQGLKSPGESGTSPVTIDISIIGSACTGNGIQVDVSYDAFPLTMPFIGSLIGSQTVGISATATDTILSPKCE